MTEVGVQPVSVQNPRTTWEGCSVLLDINDGDRLLFARLSAGATVKIGNKKCSLQPLIGCPFGSLFQVESGLKGPYLSRVIAPAKDDLPQEGGCLLKDESRDNRSLVDDNTAQTLSGEDIEAMRRQGATGDQIVEALIANSSTFENKTLFSQEKYRIKKQKKYAPRVLVRRPFARSVCEAYFKKQPAKIGFLRVDNLSLLLSMANVCAYSDVLVVDMVGGMLTGAVAERLGGAGYVCNAYFGVVRHPMDITRMFNFNNEISIRIVQTSLSELCSAQDKNSEPGTENGGKEVTNLWRENGFSSLIIAAPELDTWSTVQELLPLLAYSAPFAIYHQYLQPLATCMHNLQVSKLAISLQISEPWLREYQAYSFTLAFFWIMPCLHFLRKQPPILMMRLGCFGASIKNSSIYADECLRRLHSKWDKDM